MSQSELNVSQRLAEPDLETHSPESPGAILPMQLFYLRILVPKVKD